MRIEGFLDEVPMKIPESIPSTVSGELEWWGSPDAMTLQGKLHVVRARYTEKADLEKSMLEWKRSHGVQARLYDKSGEWMRYDVQLVVDGDCRIENDVARGGVKGELQV